MFVREGYSFSYFLEPHGWNAFRISHNGAPNPSQCSVVYEQNGTNAELWITIDTSGC